MDTPTTFWPPYVGTEFNPDPNDEERKRMFMSDQEYKQTLQENRELNYHPEMIFSPNCPSRDFKYQEPEITGVPATMEFG